MGSYLPSTPKDREEMLKFIGMSSLKDLFRDIPKEMLLEDSVGIAPGLSEMEARAEMERIAARNTAFPLILRGAGAYDHYIPAIVSTVTSKEEFVTTYTPYQAEISQGVLQSIFEYQTMICELTGMDASNASVYDGASAAAEAAMMCLGRGKARVYAAATAHPDTLNTIRTYCWGRGVPFELLPEKDGRVDKDALKNLAADAACVFLQQPNFYGLLEDAEDVASLAHAAGAKAVMGVYPIMLGLCKTPGELGFDIATGEGQPLGLALNWGGPWLGFMAARKDMTRSLPGRIVGETTDKQGRRAFVLTLQAREQHIRREKASSNVCTNQALCAMTAAVYMAAMGPQGMEEVASLCWDHAHWFQEELAKIPGFERVHGGEFFNEFLTKCPIAPEKLEAELAARGILSGLPHQGGMLWCLTEKTGKNEMDRALAAIREVCGQ
ncbi:MAG TPA: aminomethyl-transferring glycine dehydrogenase subunit GcvPA [Candidatus Limnocylindria bacterium]|nr:aminomethyl-transferring glycine dehydrogenase subunit GcvPA [Candidatus Limnocylindria bacterium]